MGTSCYKQYVRKFADLTDCRSIDFNTLFVIFLRTGTAFVFYHSNGKMPCVRQDLKIIVRSLQMDLSYNIGSELMVIYSSLKKLTGKKRPQIKLQRFRKV